MGWMDLLQQYTNPTAVPAEQAEAHFDQVAQQVPKETLGQGITAALQSEQTPPFHDMVGQLFGQSNPQQRAGVLNALLGSLGPGALSALAGGTLGRILGGLQAQGQAPQITPTQASQITPQDAAEVAKQAQANDPSVVDRVGGFYAQHPQVVKALGGIALAIALGKIANRQR